MNGRAVELRRMYSDTPLARFLNAQFIRFVFIGGLNTILAYLSYLAFLVFLPYQAAYSVAYVIGVFTSYCLHSRFVFCKPIVLRKALQYPVVCVTQFVIGFSLLTLLVDSLRVDERLASPVVMLLNLPVTFVLSRFLITRGADS